MDAPHVTFGANNNQGRGGRRGRGRGGRGRGRGGNQNNAPRDDAAHDQQPQVEQQNEERQKQEEPTSTVTTVKSPVNLRASASSTSGTKESCLICYTEGRPWSVGKCGHRTSCIWCSLQRRECYSQRDCIVCKEECPQIIATHDMTASYANLVSSGKYYLDSTFDIWFPTADRSLQAEARRLLKEYFCPICKTDQKSILKLRQHVTQIHGSYYCDVCLQHRKVFLPDQKLYPNRNALELHYQHGDNSEIDGLIEIPPHPSCDFCKDRYFSNDALYEHLNKQHFSCFLCEKHKSYRYFVSYKTLEKHFKKEHYLCSDLECLAQRFVVFDSALDLKGHQLEVHSGSQKLSGADGRRARTVDLNFDFGVFMGQPGRRQFDEQRFNQRQYTFDRQHEENNAALAAAMAHEERPAVTIGGGLSSSSSSSRSNTNNVARSNNTHNDGNGANGQFYYNNANSSNYSSSSSTTSMPVQAQPPPWPKELPIPPSNPAELETRNRSLIERLRNSLSEADFNKFKQISADFRRGTITPGEYYLHFRSFFKNSSSYIELFPELIALLPDPDKRSNLWVAALKMEAERSKNIAQTQANKPQQPKVEEKGPSTLAERLSAPSASVSLKAEDFPTLPSSGPSRSAAGGAGPSLGARAAYGGNRGNTMTPPPLQSADHFPSLPGGRALTPEPEQFEDYFNRTVSLSQPQEPTWPATAKTNKGRGKGNKKKQVILHYG